MYSKFTFPFLIAQDRSHRTQKENMRTQQRPRSRTSCHLPRQSFKRRYQSHILRHQIRPHCSHGSTSTWSRYQTFTDISHLIEPPPSTPPPQQNPPPQTNANPRNPMMGPGVMLGSITIPDGTPAPNINQVNTFFPPLVIRLDIRTSL